ncbi:MAG: hypothetical protein WAN42_02760 [Pseudolabrys sp.]
MSVQNDHDRHSDYEPAQLALFGAAAIVLFGLRVDRRLLNLLAEFSVLIAALLAAASAKLRVDTLTTLRIRTVSGR